jgi:phage FluMu protein Com
MIDNQKIIEGMAADAAEAAAVPPSEVSAMSDSDAEVTAQGAYAMVRCPNCGVVGYAYLAEGQATWVECLNGHRFRGRA